MSCDYTDRLYDSAYDECYEILGREPTEQEWEEMFQELCKDAEARWECSDHNEDY